MGSREMGGRELRLGVTLNSAANAQDISVKSTGQNDLPWRRGAPAFSPGLPGTCWDCRGKQSCGGLDAAPLAWPPACTLREVPPTPCCFRRPEGQAPSTQPLDP